MMYLLWLFVYLVSGSLNFLNLYIYTFTKCRTFSAVVYSIFLCPISSLLSFWGLMTRMWYLCCSHRPQRFCLLFQPISFQSFRLANFSCPVFRFADSFPLPPFCCWAHPLSFLFSLLYCFSSKIFIWFFFISFISVLRLSISLLRLSHSYLFQAQLRVFLETSW